MGDCTVFERNHEIENRKMLTNLIDTCQGFSLQTFHLHLLADSPFNWPTSATDFTTLEHRDSVGIGPELICGGRDDTDLSGSLCFTWIGPKIIEMLTKNQVKKISILTVTIVTMKENLPWLP